MKARERVIGSERGKSRERKRGRRGREGARGSEEAKGGREEAINSSFTKRKIQNSNSNKTSKNPKVRSPTELIMDPFEEGGF